MSKKGLTRLRRVLAASIKNSVAARDVVNYLTALESRLEASEKARARDELWEVLSPKVGDTLYAHRKYGPFSRHFGKALTIAYVYKRSRAVVLMDGSRLPDADLMTMRASKDPPVEAFTNLCQNEGAQ